MTLLHKRRPLHLISTAALVVSTALVLPECIQAFAPTGHYFVGRTTPRRTTTTSSSTTSLNLSDIPRDNNDDESSASSKMTTTAAALLKDMQQWWYRQLPPSPEDQLTVMGDIGLLLVYGILSHMMPTLVVRSTFAAHGDKWQEAVQALDPDLTATSSAAAAMATAVPSWLEDGDAAADVILKSAAQQDLLPQFGPLFSTVGSASISLVTCWLLAGWIHHSFLYQNTLECHTSKVLIKTLQTWCTMLLLLVTAAGCVHLGVQSVLSLDTVMTSSISSNGMMIGWITKSDFMYILDSFTVLVAWRFMVSSLFGSGGSGGENNKSNKKKDNSTED